MLSSRVPVLHLIDSLALGGAESVAVKIANALPQNKFESHLCVTRARGPLETRIAPHVCTLYLDRAHRFDLRAIKKLSGYIRENNIRILHAHSSSLFIARPAHLLNPSCRVIWHVHYGRYATVDRPALVYRTITCRIDGVITVNEPLAKWAIEELRIPKKRVWYLPNFVEAEQVTEAIPPELPGQKGFRIICVAQFRPEKDHITLLRAFQEVVQHCEIAHLLLVGDTVSGEYYKTVQNTVDTLSLRDHVSFLGQRTDVPRLLRNCDIGVLSSVSEGLPLALLEYGVAGLGSVTTDVGQCREVLAGGQCGVVVPVRESHALASALTTLLVDAQQRHTLGQKFRERVQADYSRETVIERLTQLYTQIL